MTTGTPPRTIDCGDASVFVTLGRVSMERDRFQGELRNAVNLLRDLAAAGRMDDLVSVTDPFLYGWWSAVEEGDALGAWAAGVLKEDTKEAHDG